MGEGAEIRRTAKLALDPSSNQPIAGTQREEVQDSEAILGAAETIADDGLASLIELVQQQRAWQDAQNLERPIPMGDRHKRLEKSVASRE